MASRTKAGQVEVLEAPPEDDAEVRRFAASIMATLRLRPPKPGARFGPDSYAVGYHSAKSVFSLVPMIGLIVGLVLARSLRKTPPRA